MRTRDVRHDPLGERGLGRTALAAETYCCHGQPDAASGGGLALLGQKVSKIIALATM